MPGMRTLLFCLVGKTAVPVGIRFTALWGADNHANTTVENNVCAIMPCDGDILEFGVLLKVALGTDDTIDWTVKKSTDGGLNWVSTSVTLAFDDTDIAGTVKKYTTAGTTFQRGDLLCIESDRNQGTTNDQTAVSILFRNNDPDNDGMICFSRNSINGSVRTSNTDMGIGGIRDSGKEYGIRPPVSGKILNVSMIGTTLTGEWSYDHRGGGNKPWITPATGTIFTNDTYRLTAPNVPLLFHARGWDYDAQTIGATITFRFMEKVAGTIVPSGSLVFQSEFPGACIVGGGTNGLDTGALFLEPTQGKNAADASTRGNVEGLILGDNWSVGILGCGSNTKLSVTNEEFDVDMLVDGVAFGAALVVEASPVRHAVDRRIEITQVDGSTDERFCFRYTPNAVTTDLGTVTWSVVFWDLENRPAAYGEADTLDEDVYSHWDLDEATGTRADTEGTAAFLVPGAHTTPGNQVGLIGNEATFSGEVGGDLQVLQRAYNAADPFNRPEFALHMIGWMSYADANQDPSATGTIFRLDASSAPGWQWMTTTGGRDNMDYRGLVGGSLDVFGPSLSLDANERVQHGFVMSHVGEYMETIYGGGLWVDRGVMSQGAKQGSFPMSMGGRTTSGGGVTPLKGAMDDWAAFTRRKSFADLFHHYANDAGLVKANWDTVPTITGDYNEGTITNPVDAHTDVSILIDLSNMGNDWWAGSNTDDTRFGRVTLADGTLLPCDWIAFNRTAKTGFVMFKREGTLANSGTQKFRIYPPNTSRTSNNFDREDRYGQYNAYDVIWSAFWPLAEGSGLVAFDRCRHMAHMALKGAATWSTNADGEVCIDFDGSTGYCVADYANPRLLDAVVTYTVTAQVEFDNITTSQTIAASSRDIENTGIGVNIDPDANIGLVSWNVKSYTVAISALSATTVYDFAWTLGDDANFTFEAFLNGASEGTATHTAGVNQSTAGPWTLGVSIEVAGTFINFLNGRMRMVGVHNEVRSDDWIAYNRLMVNTNFAFWNSAWTWSGPVGGAALTERSMPRGVDRGVHRGIA